MDLITTPAQTGYTPPATSIVHNAAVSLTDRAPSAPVHIVQYDMTLPIVAVSLTANGQPYAVPSGAAVNFRMGKPDGNYIYNPALGVSSDGQTVYIAITQQTAAAHGTCQPVVEIVLDGAVAASGAFTLIIDENPVPESAIVSDNEYMTLQQILAEVQQAAQLVQSQAGNLQTVVDNLEDIKNAAANAQAAAQSAQDAQTAAQQALGFRTFFSAISPDANGNLDPSRPMTTPSAQASWTIESRGDRIQSVQVNGFTQQAGTGDASPANVRAISTAGLRLVAYICTGQENWTTSGLQSGGYRALLPATALPVPAKIPASSSEQATIYSSFYKPATAAQSYAGVESVSIPGVSGGIYICDRNYTASDPEPWKQHLQALYAAGTPLVFWYKAADESQATGLYIPIQSQGHAYRCEMMELTAPLCDGDKVESCVPSGCDKRVVLDGSANITVDAASTIADVMRFSVSLPDADASAPYALSDRLPYIQTTYINTPCICVVAGPKLMVYLKKSLLSTQDKAGILGYLDSNPLIVWYRSTAYAEHADIPVQLETHANALVTVDGTNTLFTQGTDGYTVSLPNAANGAVICNQFSNLTAASKAVTIPASQFPSSVTDVDSANVWAQSNPVTILYPLATPAVYAHDPVELVAVPYTEDDATAAQQLAATPSTLPYIDSPEVPMLLDAAEPASAASPLASTLPVAGTYIVSSQDGTTVLVSLKAMQDGGDAATVGGMTPVQLRQDIDAASLDGQTLEQINTAIAAAYIAKTALIDLVYPVGSIYMSVANVSPQTFLGGTWQQIQGQFLLAASETYPAGSTGGEAAHALTTAEGPTHTHTTQTFVLSQGNSTVGGGTTPCLYGSTAGSGTGSSGDGQPHNNMPPYLAVYMWQRTA